MTGKGETDFAIRSDAVTPKHIVQMRKDGGGLICTAVHPLAAERLGLPFASDVLRCTNVAEKTGDIPYDRKNHSSFSLWVNHKNTFTGITDQTGAHGQRDCRPGEKVPERRRGQLHRTVQDAGTHGASASGKWSP